LLTGRTAGSPLRAWVIGCSTGQEAYSLAISFLEVEAALGLEVLVRVFASDLSETGLVKARLGQYTQAETANLSLERLQRFFVPVDHGVQVSKRLREMCVFARHDITRDPPFGQLDLVLCSNVLIYLDRVLQRRVLENVHYALRPSGYLVLGPAETTAGVEGLFSPLDRKQKIYMRRHVPSRPHVSLVHPGDSVPTPGKPAKPLRAMPLQWSTAELQRAAETVFFADYPSASVLVNPELEVLHFQGRTAPYLEAPVGGPTAQVLRLAHPDLRLPLGRLLRQARKQHAPARRRGVRLEVGGREQLVDLTVLPIPLDDGEGQYHLVVFDHRPGPSGRQRSAHEPDEPGTSDDDGSARVMELESELAANREYLQAIIDQQDASQAELQAAYEASLSINEEYQSTNEELESTKEELQSLNEELLTVNEQLHQRNSELQARTADLANLLESIDMPMLLLTREGQLRAFNTAAARELGFGREQVGALIATTHFPVPASELHQLTEGAFNGDEIQEREFELPNRQWRTLRVWPVRPATDSATVAVALIDITKLKSEVNEASARRAYSEAIVETVMQPLVVLDGDLKMVHANRAFHEMFGTDAETVVGKKVSELGTGDWDATGVNDFLRRVLESDRPLRSAEVTIESARLGTRTFQLSAGALHGQRSWAGRLLLTLEDITTRKQNEASAMEASRLQAVGELAGGVAHEINNQMTVVLGFADALLARSRQEGHPSDDLVRIARAARRSADVTRQLLAFGRRQLLDPVVLDLNTVINGSEPLLRRALGPNIRLELSLGTGIGRVKVDQAQLEQVLVNLILNARDAMPEGGVLRIETSSVLIGLPASTSVGQPPAVEPGSFVRLVVGDTGVGMDRSTRSRIFEPFFTTKPRWQGTGLGLASVYGTVKQSGGSIWVESEPGNGTTFVIDLPQVIAAEPEAESTPPVPVTALVGGEETILVVEDEEAVREWIRRMLAELGYKALTSANGSDALRLMETGRHVDLVLTDVVMPGIGGGELQARLKQIRPGLPVVLMSGYPRQGLVSEGRLEPNSAFLHKPFDMEALAAVVRQSLASAAGGGVGSQPEPSREARFG
jgi:two-component system CheB/CheR fusion protein